MLGVGGDVALAFRAGRVADRIADRWSLAVSDGSVPRSGALRWVGGAFVAWLGEAPSAGPWP